uniref:Spermatogenesis associated 6 n=1 Tax=Vombatus ursinus TaxID=29139 RepID=A0A4X2LM48_VOMUR
MQKVKIDLSGVSCPRLQLKDKEDVYLSVCVFGQYKKTPCVPPIFPLVFNARMVFEKVYSIVSGHRGVSQHLHFQDFIFPGPKQMNGHHDSNRQVMMQRISGIRGLAPKLEFSTTSVITECLISTRRCRGFQDKLSYHATPLERTHGRMQIRGPTRSSKKKSRSPERQKYCTNPRNYEQPTISSKTHSPSPYTKRRMCELSEDTRQRLAHLNLGPYEFKKDTDKPPFVLRRADPSSPKPEVLLGPSGREPSREGWCKLHNGELGRITRPSHGRDQEDSLDRCEEYLAPRQSRPCHVDRSLLVHSAPSSMQKRSPSPVLNQSTLRERYHSDWCSPSNSDEIHERVKNVLKSHGAHQRYLYDERDEEKDEELDPKRSLAHKDSACDSDPEYSSAYRPRALVHLDNSEYWSNRAAAYKGKSHRGNFENSMDKIYRNLYRKACGSSTQESF